MTIVLPSKYVDIEPLTPGKNAAVWRAKNRLVNRAVFLKAYPLSDEAPESALHEPRLLVELSHQSLAKIFSADVVDETHEKEADNEGEAASTKRILLEMELVDGGSMQDLIDASIRSGEWLPVHETIELVRDAIGGVAHMHSRGIVHRDLKPANVMLRTNLRGKREAVVTDLGLASRLSTSGRTVDTGHALLYRPPEVWESKGYSRASDAYQLGVVLFQLLCGEIDYSLGKLPEEEVGKAILAGRLLKWRTLGPHVEPRLRSIIERCVGPEEKRYAELTELSVDLHNARAVQHNSVYRKTPSGFVIDCERRGRIDRVTAVSTGTGNERKIECASRVNTPSFRRRGKATIIDHPDLARCQVFRRILRKTLRK